MRVLVADWDETITVRDTTALVGAVPQKYSPHEIRPFEHYFKVYMDAYKRFTEEWAAEGKSRDSVARETEYQQRMSSVEMSSVAAMERDQYFRGVPMDRFKELADQVQLQDHVIDFLRELQDPFYILSVNWCRTLIETVLKNYGITKVTVLANDLEVDSDGVTTGNYDGVSIRTGYDKLQQLNQIRQAHPDRDVVYIGDSSGDVLPIVEADTGIVVAGGKGLQYVQQLAKVTQLAGTLERAVYVGTWQQLRDAWSDK